MLAVICSNICFCFRGAGGRPLSGGGGGFRGRRKGYEVVVSGLPPSGSWQDLKDHCRSIGEIIFADVDRRGGGVIEFLRYGISILKAIIELTPFRRRQILHQKVGRFQIHFS